jgi:CubicO group peptidase (beta-lactamase class C family)
VAGSMPLSLQRTSPEAVGISSTAALDFVQTLEDLHDHPLDAVHGFMLLRHGAVAAEGWWAPYHPQSPHSFYSLSKSFTATGIGLAVAEGLLSVDDPVLKFFPGDAPADPSQRLQAMRVRHLLSMNTGHHEDTTPRVFHGEDDNWPRAFLSLPVEHEPGSWFIYNTAATYMLSAIITKLTGQRLLDYLRPRLLDPLGIEDPTWETDPRGIDIGGSGLHAKTEDIARFGQMFLQKGVWDGRRMVPDAWIAEATSVHSDNSNTQNNPDWSVGYGYQFWRCRHRAYRGDGAFGQFCLVMPEQDAVLAITGGVRDMQAVLDTVWTHLLPAMQRESLPSNPEALGELREKLAALSLPRPVGRFSSPGAEQASGKIYRLGRNDLGLETLSIAFDAERATLTARDQSGEHVLRIGSGAWLNGTSDVRGKGAEPVAACGAWTADDVYETRVCFTGGEFCFVVRAHFTNDELRLEIDPNVSWGSPTTTSITGHAAESAT